MAVQYGTTPQLLLAIRPGFRAVTFKLAEEAMEALTRGEADVAFLWGPTAGYYNKTGSAARTRSCPSPARDFSGKRLSGRGKARIH